MQCCAVYVQLSVKTEMGGVDTISSALLAKGVHRNGLKDYRNSYTSVDLNGFRKFCLFSMT